MPRKKDKDKEAPVDVVEEVTPEEAPVEATEDIVEEVTVDPKLMALRAQNAKLTAEALEIEELQAKNKALLGIKNRTGGKLIEVETADYVFENRMDIGTSFVGRYSAPRREGGKNVSTKYECKDGGTITLPVKYAEYLNGRQVKTFKWVKVGVNPSRKEYKTSRRFRFDKVG